MRIFLVLLFMGVSASSLAQLRVQPPFYVGAWQSNEAKTLASIAKADDVPEKSKKVFADNFYGKLVNVFTENAFTTYFVDQKPEHLNFVDAEIRVIGENQILIRYFNQSRGQMVERELTFKDGCYTIPSLQYHYDEYFCKVEGE